MAKKIEQPPVIDPNISLVPPDSAGTAMAEFEYGDDAGLGYQNQTTADASLPFIKLLQGLSPEIEKFDEAKPGCFFNTVTEMVYPRDTGFLFVPALTRHVAAEWVPRDQGGGFRGHHEMDSAVMQKAIASSPKFGKYRTEEGNQLTETFYVYGAICNEAGLAESMGIIAFWSTKIKAYKQWMTRLRGFRLRLPNGRISQPPLYAHLTRFTSSKEKNPEGEFFVPRPQPADPRGIQQSLLRPDDERFLLAKQCMELVIGGEAKIDYSKQGDAGAEEGNDKTFM